MTRAQATALIVDQLAARGEVSSCNVPPGALEAIRTALAARGLRLRLNWSGGFFAYYTAY